MGLLSRYPVVSLQHLDSVGGMFFAWRVVLDTKLGRIQVLNVHLRPPISDGGSWVVGYFSTRDNRLREIENHAAALDPKLPTRPRSSRRAARITSRCGPTSSGWILD